MTPTIAGIFIGFLVLALIFGVIERFWPGVRGQRRIRRGFGTDLIYWLFTPLVTKTITRFALVLVIFPMLWLLGRSTEISAIQEGFGPLSRLPLWVQAVSLVVLGDFIGYWSHRWFHGKRLWPFHAVHHSSRDLDWLSSVRVHPVNDAVSKALRAVPLLFLGFSPFVVAGYLPFLTFHAILLHANVNWDFGPLRRVVSSPVFHRWHHTCEERGQDKNFGGLLPLWDILFGTFYMPRNELPKEFGVSGVPVPENFLRQLAYPFASRRTESQP